jgi:hypothetical protein
MRRYETLHMGAETIGFPRWLRSVGDDVEREGGGGGPTTEEAERVITRMYEQLVDAGRAGRNDEVGG